MADNQDKTSDRIRIKNSYRERIFAESQYLDKSYLETLYFMIDCYFAFKKGVFPIQQAIMYTPPAFTPMTINQNQNQQQHSELTPSTLTEQEDSDDDTFSLDFDL